MDTTHAEGNAYPAAKLVQGTTLRAALDETKSFHDRLALLPRFVDVCQSVGAAHERGIVHRNLDPGNILIGEYNEAVVIDWGLCKTRGRQDDLADAIEEAVHGLREGTVGPVKTLGGDIGLEPAYLAPELVLGHTEKVDARSDVYSLGAILYELLTGAAPYADEDHRRVAACVISKRPNAIAAHEPDASPELVTICERAMHKEPSARYSSAKQLAEELRRYQFAPLVRETPPVDEAANKAVLWALASVSLVLLCIVGVSYLRATRERDGALRDLRYAEQQRTAGEEAQEKMARELEMAKQARSIAEAERDHADGEFTRIEQALKAAEEARARAQQALEQRKEAPAPDGEPDNADPGPAPVEEESPVLVEEGEPADKTALPAPVSGETVPPETDAGARPAGLTRAQLEAALPDLESSLKVEETEQGPAIVVRVEGSAVLAGLEVLGFKDGDVITRVNRIEVNTIEETKKVLSRVSNDPGFSIRIIRDGLSAWMRVSVGESASPKETATPTTPPQPAAPPQPPADETIKPETSEVPPTPAATAEIAAGS